MFALLRGFRTRSWFDELNPPRTALAFETVGRLRRMQDLLYKWLLEIKGVVFNCCVINSLKVNRVMDTVP